jgi:hypothetical protein
MATNLTTNRFILEQGHERKNTLGVMQMDEDLPGLCLDDQFMILLHKKIMDKTGGAQRKAKKYYMDQYKKTGIIPKPLLNAGQGVMEGRRCSGRPRALPDDVINRFIEMVKASCDEHDQRFFYITRKARKITTYHKLLEHEFGKKISIHALRRLVHRQYLHVYLQQPDFDGSQIDKGYFNPEQIFDLIQVDGCQLQYIKIKDETNHWRKPQVIEFFDTGSRYILVLEFYFSETNLNAVDLFTRFLMGVPIPNKRIRLRPDCAKAFLNLKRPIHELNIKYSMPQGFYMEADFAAVRSPKHKVHLESSHRSLHDFEILIIKHFEDKIVKTERGFIFQGNKKIPVTVTFLDITIQELRHSGMLELYRKQHNEQSHRFSEKGKTQRWVPGQRLRQYLSDQQTMQFEPDHIDAFMRYGFDKKNASVSAQKTIIYNKHKYTVVVGAEKFSAHKSTPVLVSHHDNKLYIFECGKDGVYLGEALCQPASKKPTSSIKKTEKRLKQNQVEQIAGYLENRAMSVDINALIACYRDGLTFSIAKAICEANTARYDQLGAKLDDPGRAGFVRFNAFLIDFKRYHQTMVGQQYG